MTACEQYRFQPTHGGSSIRVYWSSIVLIFGQTLLIMLALCLMLLATYYAQNYACIIARLVPNMK